MILYEAADIDGASKWKQIWHITIPLLMPSIMIVTIMSSISAMKVFEEIYVMTGGRTAEQFEDTRLLYL